MQPKTKKIVIGDKTLILETGKIARQANGAVMLHCDDTTLLATACASNNSSEEIDFLPLRVDYQEKFSSVGKTLGGFIKREGRPTERETLVSRLIDRPIRPLFPNGYYNEVQVLSYVYSYDAKHQPDVLAICASSAALIISDIPFAKPIGAVRIGMIENQFILNPSFEEMKDSKLDLIIAGTHEAILMIEGYCDFLPEEKLIEALDLGHKHIQTFCQELMNWQQEVGKEKDFSSIAAIPKSTNQAVADIAKTELQTALFLPKKQERELALSAIHENVNTELLKEDSEHLKRNVQLSLKNLKSEIMREKILKTETRVDGRKLNEIRPLNMETSFLKRTHGSALFTRGETQAIAVCTLGGETMGQRYEDLHGDATRKFYMQYFFPPFSVGEVGRAGPAGRREIGHGKLAEKGLSWTLPNQEEFPYVIRLESNITESNGSSSMASVCGGCLALMDAGVPIKRPVSGIAMGLILQDQKYSILSDILGTEDALGDMDFKVTGDDKGVTAFQMDIKVEGITLDIMKKALEQAKKGRIHILNAMLEVCPSHKSEMSIYAPRIETMKVKPSQIGIVIGPGGKQIRQIVDETGVEIDINDDGIVSISSNNEESMKKAKEIIFNLTADVEIGKTYKGKVVSIVPFGMFVQIYGKEGLCHISEIDHTRVENVRDYFKEGDSVEVKVLDINDRGQIKLSRKALLEKPQTTSK